MPDRPTDSPQRASNLGEEGKVFCAGGNTNGQSDDGLCLLSFSRYPHHACVPFKGGGRWHETRSSLTNPFLERNFDALASLSEEVM